MKDLKTLLIESDPLRHDDGLSAETLNAIRQSVIVAARSRPERATAWWPQPLAVAAVIALMLTIGGVMGHRMPGANNPEATTVYTSGTPAEPGPRQVQFTTPGGTQIIWTLDPDFHMKEVVP
jgi:hypothetical protein